MCDTIHKSYDGCGNGMIIYMEEIDAARFVACVR